MTRKDRYEVQMDPIFDLFNLILKIAFIGGAIIFTVNIVRSRKFKNVKHEIEVLQARLSQYRLALKSKVKKKSQTFRVTFKSPVAEGDVIDQTIKSLCENPFEKSDDFQAYFEVSRKIVQLLQIDGGTAPGQEEVENSFMCSDFKVEMDIVRLIKQMSDLTVRINNSIDDYNSRTRKATQHLPKIEAMSFPALAEINKIFSDKKEESAPAQKAS